MATRIKGITIEINGETTGLNKALKEVEDQCAKNVRELKEIEKHLKFDPGNTELITQKQAVLEKQIETTSEKLKRLKAAEEDVQEAFKNGDIKEEKYREFKREIEITEASLKNYQTQLKESALEQGKLETSTKRLQAMFEATETKLDDYADALGTRLVRAISNGTASSEQMETAIKKIGEKALGADADIGKLRTALDSLDDGNGIQGLISELDKIKGAAGEASKAVEEIAEATKGEAFMSAMDQLSGFGEGFKGIGDSSTGAANDLETATNKMQMYFGLTKEEAASLGEMTKGIFKDNFGESLDNVTEGLLTVKNNIKGIDDETLESITKQALTLDNSFGIDMNESMRGVNGLMQAFGMDAQSAMDYLVTGTQNGLDKTGELGDNLAEYAVLFAQNGYSEQEMFSILQTGLDSGAYNLDRVNDLVSQFGIRIADGSIPKAVGELGGNFQSLFDTWKEGGGSNSELFQILGTEIANLGTEQEKATAASAIFGSMGEDSGYKVIEAMTQVKGQYDNVTGAASTMADNSSTATGTMQRNWEALQLSLAPLGEALATLANAIMPSIIAIAESMSQAFAGLPEPIQGIIVGIGLVVAAIAIIMPIIGGMIAAFKIAAPVLGGIKTAFAFVSGVISTLASTVIPALSGALAFLAANPIVLIIAAIAALVAGIVWLWNTNEDFRNFITGCWQGICDFFGPTLNTIGNTISQGWGALNAFIAGDTEGMKTHVMNLWNGLPTEVQGAISTISSIGKDYWGALNAFFVGDTEGMKTHVVGIWNALPSGVQGALSTLGKVISDKFNEIKTNVQNAWDIVNKIFSGELSFPKIKLPHFRVEGSFSLNPPSMPTFGVDWYKKGGILTRPTIFGSDGSRLMAGGEAGKEAVIPLNEMYETIEKMIKGSEEPREEITLNLTVLTQLDERIIGKSVYEGVVNQLNKNSRTVTISKGI